MELSKCFVAVKVDGDDREDLVKEWQVRDLPLLLFLAPDGGVLARRENDYNNGADAVFAVMQRAASSYDAVREAEAAAREAPQDPEKIKALALKYVELQLWDPAAEAFERCQTNDPENRLKFRAKADEYLVYIDLMRGHHDACVLRAEAYESRWPGARALPQVLHWRGIALLRGGRTDEAIAVWERVIREHPKSEQAKLGREAIEKARNAPGK